MINKHVLVKQSCAIKALVMPLSYRIGKTPHDVVFIHIKIGGKTYVSIFYGVTIREGTDGVPGDAVEALFEDAGWARNTLNWQKEKFSLIFINSTWAFTVWDNNKMIGMVRVISDKIMAANIMDFVVLSEYRGKGIGKKLWNFVFKNFLTAIGSHIPRLTILISIRNVVLKLRIYPKMVPVRIMDIYMPVKMDIDKSVYS